MTAEVAIAEPEATRLDLPDGALTVLRAGEGEPALFLHGTHFAGRWLAFHERLAGSCALVYPIHPGFEEGQAPRWLHGLDDLVLCYRDLLDALEIERAHLIGWALGGWLAAEMAVLSPERVRSLTLLAPLGLRVAEHPPADYLAVAPEQLAGLLFNDEAAGPGLLPDFEDPEEFSRFYGENGVTARLIWERRYDLRLDRRLPRVRVPSLLVWPENDRLVPYAHAARWAELLPGSRLEVVPGAGHAVLVQQPERIADLVASFLAEVAGA